MYKTDEQIYADLRGVILSFLKDSGLTDWQVLQLEQPTIQTVKSPTVFLSKVVQQRYHWQNHKYLRKYFTMDDETFRLRLNQSDDFMPIFATVGDSPTISIGGWNAKKDSSLQLSERYLLEVWIQVSAYKRRTTGKISEVSSADILNYILTFLMGFNGIKAMRKLGYMPLPTKEILNPTFGTPSDATERFPNFTYKFILEQTQETSVPSASYAKTDIHRI